MLTDSPQQVTPLGSRLYGLQPALLLARLEAITIARHPFMLIAVAAALWFSLRGLRTDAVVWQSLSVQGAGSTLPLAVASFLLGSTMASGDWRDQTEEFLDSLLNRRLIQTLGRIGGAAAPVGYSILIMIVTLVVGLTGRPAGEIIWTELAAGPTLVAISWIVGLAVGGFRRFRAAPSLVLVSYLFLQLLGSPDLEIGASGPSQFDLGQLLLWVPPSAFESPFELLLRPSTLRILYLVSILLAVVALVIRRADRAGAGHRWLLATVVIVGAASATLGYQVVLAEPNAAWAAPSLDRARADWSKLTANQECESIGSLSYCAYPGFDSWIEEWSRTISPAARLAEARVRGVVQRPENTGFDDMDPGPEWLITDFSWDNPHSDSPVNSFALAAGAGNLTVGLPTGFQETCDAGGQGRSIVPLWTAATSVDGGIELLQRLAQSTGPIRSIDGVPLGNAAIGTDAAAVALALTERSREEVTEVFVARYDELVDPTTTTNEVAGWFVIASSDLGPSELQVSLPACG